MSSHVLSNLAIWQSGSHLNTIAISMQLIGHPDTTDIEHCCNKYAAVNAKLKDEK
jgi:hypothetical protein